MLGRRKSLSLLDPFAKYAKGWGTLSVVALVKDGAPGHVHDLRDFAVKFRSVDS